MTLLYPNPSYNEICLQRDCTLHRCGFLIFALFLILFIYKKAGPRSAVGNMSGYRCVSDCRSRGREFDPSPVPYFRGD